MSKQTDTHRAFVSIDIEPLRLTAWKARLSDLGYQKILLQPHITLAFIGNLTTEQLVKLNQHLCTIKSKTFSLTIAGSGHFKVKNKHILWAGIGNNSMLNDLQKQVVNAVKKVVFYDNQQDYIPHVSMIRNQKFDCSMLTQLHQQLAPLREVVAVSGFGLYRSNLTNDGAKYEQLHHYSLL